LALNTHAEWIKLTAVGGLSDLYSTDIIYVNAVNRRFSPNGLPKPQRRTLTSPSLDLQTRIRLAVFSKPVLR